MSNTDDNANTPVLTFTLGQQVYALPIEDVVEVASMVELIEVSASRPEVLGVANRHGAVLLVVDLRHVMGQPVLPVDVSTLFVVVKYQEHMLGLVVDTVEQVDYLPLAQISKSTASSKYIRGIISYKQSLIQIIALEPLVSVYLPETPTGDWLKVDN